MMEKLFSKRCFFFTHFYYQSNASSLYWCSLFCNNVISSENFQIELEDPLENLGVKLVRQAGAKTNNLAGDGSTTSVILAHGLITEGTKVHVNPI